MYSLIRITIAHVYSDSFNYEERSEYSLFLQVVDNSPISPRTSSPSQVSVTIRNVDDEPTVFDQPEYSKLVMK